MIATNIESMDFDRVDCRFDRRVSAPGFHERGRLLHLLRAFRELAFAGQDHLCQMLVQGTLVCR